MSPATDQVLASVSLDDCRHLVEVGPERSIIRHSGIDDYVGSHFFLL